MKKVTLTEEQVKEELDNTIVVLNTIGQLVPGKIDGGLVGALETMRDNPLLLALLTNALAKL